MEKDLLKNIKNRRSIRKYTKQKVADRVLEKVLEAGRFAPSGLNNQPWRFIIIRDLKVKKQIADLTHYSSVFNDASVLICVLLDKKKSYHLIKDMQAIGACIQNMLLEADCLRLGACWQGQILNNEKKVLKVLELKKEEFSLGAVVTLGYPKGVSKKPSRQPLKKLILKKL